VADYAISFARPVRRELEALERKTALRIVSRIEQLATDPRPVGCRKLHGATDLWRVRIGDYRIIYSVDDDARLVDVIAVRHRRDAYR
jgi:mRNA interferase RelE/StbE